MDKSIHKDINNAFLFKGKAGRCLQEAWLRNNIFLLVIAANNRKKGGKKQERKGKNRNKRKR